MQIPQVQSYYTPGVFCVYTYGVYEIVYHERLGEFLRSAGGLGKREDLRLL